MIERAYGDKDAHLASAAENQILIFHFVFIFIASPLPAMIKLWAGNN
jgi:hypothetical protein